MILGKKKSVRFNAVSANLPIILFCLLFAVVSIALINNGIHSGNMKAGSAVVLDAESRFPGVNHERYTDEQAHSGSHAYRLPGDGRGAQYGWSYTLENLVPGEVYRVSVWRLGNNMNEGKLAVNSASGGPLYHETGQKTGPDDRGWEKLELVFHIPFHHPPTSLKAYVYSNGYYPVLFDDLAIEKVDRWSEARFKPSVIGLQIKNNAFEKLRKKREEALQAGVLEAEDQDWVNADLTDSSGQAIPVEIRLKGDWLDHLSTNKWSFRVKVRDPFNWRRMKTFSLHTPAARYYLHEWLLHQLWEKEDVLTTRYDFVELQINGKSLGIYAYEEHFEKQLVESRRRREGPILKFSETAMWSAIRRQLEDPGYVRTGATHSSMDSDNAPVQAFGEDNLLADPTLAANWREGLKNMEAFRKGDIPPGRVFDLPRLAKFYAIADVFNAYHGLAWHNQRFYFNPVTGLLEPIGFDGFGSPPAKQIGFLGEGGLNPFYLEQNTVFAGLAQDSAFMDQYVRELTRLSAPDYFDRFIDEMRADWTPRLEWIRLEWPSYNPTLSEIREQVGYLHSLLLPFPGESLRVYRQGGETNQPALVVSNRHTLPLKVVGYGNSAEKISGRLENPVLLPAGTPRRFRMRLKRDSMIQDFASLRFLEEGALQQSVPAYTKIVLKGSAKFLFFQPLGLDTLMSAPIIPAPAPEGIAISATLFANARLKPGGPYLINGREVVFPPGKYTVREDLIVPPGYLVRFAAGAQVDLVNGAAFISRSPVEMLGDPEDPVVIRSSDGTGSGFTVLEANQASVLKNVVFDHLQTLKKGDWELTGAVTFYGSAVKMEGCTFKRNLCEDALNIIRGEFTMENCSFLQTWGDAFDADFCRGEVRRSIFRNTVNDGMDFSGSVVNVWDCKLDHNGDKGISVGEESDVHVFNTEFSFAPIAVASKDLSMAYLSNVRISDCDQGFAAYQKKPEFGGADMLVESYTATRVRRLYQAAEGSSVKFKQGEGL